MPPPPVPPISTAAAGPSQEPIPPPPISPLTPTLEPARLPDTTTPQPLLPPPQQPLRLKHSSQPAQPPRAVPPPPPEPLDFDDNPDVLALKSAISVLQIQRRRAAADMQHLARAKNRALADPDAFVRDLAAGKVRTRGDDVLRAPADAASDSDSDSDSAARPEKSEAEPWSSLPQPQNVVRCPPVNWSQYAVVGESLDRLHAEQLSHPAHGAPATFGPAGVYEFKAAPADARPDRYPGVAAPYAPGKDRIDKKPRGKKS